LSKWMWNLISHTKRKTYIDANFDIWLAVRQNITLLLLRTWYTNFLFIYTNYIN